MPPRLQSRPQLSAQHIVLISDGSLYQVLGILLTVDSLLQQFSGLLEPPVIWVGLPRHFQLTYRDYFSLFEGRVVVNFFDTELVPSDPYYVKFGLVGLVDALPERDRMLYLDYDHLVLNPIDIAVPQPGSILVSAEVKLFDSTLLKTLNQGFPMRSNRTQYHYNNSLIYGSISTIARLVKFWKELYSQLDTLMPQQREELAFTLAACASGQSLVPVSTKIQEYFRDDSRASSLFHYGGADVRALALKQLLKDRSNQFSWLNFTPDCLQQEREILVAKLATSHCELA